jgi:hypothetical protein
MSANAPLSSHDFNYDDFSIDADSSDGELRIHTPPPYTASTVGAPDDGGGPKPNPTTPVMDQWNAIPTSGQTYMIRERELGRVVVISGGRLKLEDDTREREGARWECIENAGWFGFRNRVSGQYIGHDGSGTMRATASSHREWEYLTPRRHPDGGYVLLSLFYKELWMLGVDKQGRLVRGPQGSTTWDFMRI